MQRTLVYEALSSSMDWGTFTCMPEKPLASTHFRHWGGVLPFLLPFSLPYPFPSLPFPLPFPPLIQLGGLGERCNVPQWVRAEPGHQTHFGAFRGKT